MIEKIPFNRPWQSGFEKKYLSKVLELSHFSGDGHYSFKCSEYLENIIKTKKALITHSCTAALEMTALLADIKEGDEVIMPSYTFVSTANAFVLRGATPVFIDIDARNLNLDITKIEPAINGRTKIIVPVHYAGVGCNMDEIIQIAKNYNLLVVEDAAQAYGATYKGQYLGTMGDLGTLSFHETKNIISGEGGSLLVNNEEFIDKAEIIREKGTNRKNFLKGKVDKYTWVSMGSSYLPSELISAFLLAQLESSDYIQKERMTIWNYYYEKTSQLEAQGYVRRPYVPSFCNHNAHMFYLVLREDINRDRIISEFKRNGITITFHYVPLHTSPGGLKYGKYYEELKNTDNLHKRIIRLPIWIGLTHKDLDKIVNLLYELIIDF